MCANHFFINIFLDSIYINITKETKEISTHTHTHTHTFIGTDNENKSIEFERMIINLAGVGAPKLHFFKQKI